MSDFITSDGFKPLPLPKKGEDLQEGRQYLLTPLARDMLDKEFGYRGVPTVVECIRRKVDRTRMATLTQKWDEDKQCWNTSEQSWSVILLDGQAATFRAFLGFRRQLVFPLDLVEMERRAPLYQESHVIPPSLIDEWATETRKYPLHRKLRGCSLRWWEAEHSPQRGTAARLSTSAPKKVIDLSWLDTI